MTGEQMNEMVLPIRDDARHRAALAEIERLWGAEIGTIEGDRLDVLMTLVDAYERAQWPDENIDPIDAIAARMENSGRTPLPMIWKLVRDWKMSAEVLVRPYEVKRTDSAA
jgi:HTH-type transcriptional regulator / antitoxin HigA